MRFRIGRRLGLPDGIASLERVKRSWEAFATHDPLWAILSDPAKQGNRWNAEDFFKTGRDEIEAVMATLRRLGVTVSLARVLDFGSGVGRVTQALADHFEQADGLDISRAMITKARAYNRQGERVRYHLGDGEQLPFANDTFDMVYSRIALQHVDIDHQRRYLYEFMRVMRPAGVAVFQTPAQCTEARGTQFQSPVETPDGVFTIDMNVFPRAEVQKTIEDAGGRCLHILEDHSAGPKFESYTYVAAKSERRSPGGLRRAGGSDGNS